MRYLSSTHPHIHFSQNAPPCHPTPPNHPTPRIHQPPLRASANLYPMRIISSTQFQSNHHTTTLGWACLPLAVTPLERFDIELRNDRWSCNLKTIHLNPSGHNVHWYVFNFLLDEHQDFKEKRTEENFQKITEVKVSKRAFHVWSFRQIINSEGNTKMKLTVKRKPCKLPWPGGQRVNS